MHIPVWRDIDSSTNI